MPTRMPMLRSGAAALVLALGTGLAGATPTPDAVALRAQREALREAFSRSPFQRPLVVRSSEAGDELKGEVYAIVEQPFGNTVQVLQDKARLCDVLMLHQNVKRCRPGDAASDAMALVVGRKAQHGPEQGYNMDFKFNVASSTPDFLRVQLAADGGPLGTRDHRVTLQVAPLYARSSILHLSYSYAFGGLARMATQAYMTTAGRDKVGFTVTGKTDDGRPVYINGVRGMVERNAMRYYLAIEAYFSSMTVAPAQQQEKRLSDWFALTEQHPRQLHELERDEYLAIKRRELQTP